MHVLGDMDISDHLTLLTPLRNPMAFAEVTVQDQAAQNMSDLGFMPLACLIVIAFFL